MIRAVTQATMRHLQNRPSTAAGICAFGVAFALVAGNALYSQPGSHPVPIWATRDATTTRSVAENVQATDLSSQIATTALRLENIPVPLSRPERSEQSAPALSLVEEAQKLLHTAGYYTGEVDGLYGPMTRDAVIRFQSEHALEENGQISKALLNSMRNASPAKQVAVRTSAPAPERLTIDAVIARQAGTADEVALVQEVAERVEKKIETSDLFQEDLHEIRDSALTARVQIGLINFGETDIAVDGVLGSKTSAAIRTFQQRYGLAITGTPDLAVIRKMEQIGALSES